VPTWLAGGLALARIAPVALALATFSGGLVPREVALSLALALSVALAPLVSLPVAPLSLGALALVLVRELAIGATFALSLSLAMLGVTWAVRMARAQGDAHGLVAPLARAYGLCATWLVLSLGGARAVVAGLGESFVDAAPRASVMDVRALALGAAQLATDALATALGVALPLVASVWLLEVALALVARVVGGPRASPAPLAPLALVGAAALLLVPVASRAPESVRAAIGAARALTQGLSR